MNVSNLVLRATVALTMLAVAGCGDASQSQAPAATPGGSAAPGASAAPGGSGSPAASPAGEPVTLTFHRFFGECAQDFEGKTDPAEAEGECGIIQTLTNQWNAEHPEAQLETTVVEHDQHYQRLTAGIAAGEPPDIVIMHGRLLPNFASRGVLTPLDDHFAQAGIDVEDFLPTAREHASYDGKIYALPFDLQSTLWHINLDLWEQAGLVDGSGKPMLPTSRDEFLAAAAQMKERTGKQVLTAQMDGFIGTVWAMDALVWQQGGELVSEEEGKPKANVDTEEMRNAVGFMMELFNAGHAPNNADYGAAETGFLQGEVSSLINGTWAVGIYTPQVADGQAKFKNYYVAPFPQIFDEPAAWSDSHTWAIPARENPDPAKISASVNFLKFLNDNEQHWTRTGHLTVRASVNESAEYLDQPHRAEYGAAADIVRTEPRLRQIEAFRTILNEELTAIYLGQKSVDDGLAAAQQRIDEAIALSGF